MSFKREAGESLSRIECRNDSGGVGDTSSFRTNFRTLSLMRLGWEALRNNANIRSQETPGGTIVTTQIGSCNAAAVCVITVGFERTVKSLWINVKTMARTSIIIEGLRNNADNIVDLSTRTKILNNILDAVSSFGSEVAISKIAETRHDEFALVQFGVHGSGNDSHFRVRIVEGFETFGAANHVHEDDGPG